MIHMYVQEFGLLCVGFDSFKRVGIGTSRFRMVSARVSTVTALLDSVGTPMPPKAFTECGV